MILLYSVTTALALLCVTVSAQAGPLLKAEVAEPVVEELMGGCSLKCAFPWSVEVVTGPGQKPQATKVLNDNSAANGWVRDRRGLRGGRAFPFPFSEEAPQRDER